MFTKISTNTRLTNSCLRRTCGIRSECRRSTSMYAARQSGQKGWADFCRSMAVLAGGASLKVSATSTHRQRHGGVGRVWQRRASGAGESGAGLSQRLAVFAAQRLTTPTVQCVGECRVQLVFLPCKSANSSCRQRCWLRVWTSRARFATTQPRNHTTHTTTQRTAHSTQQATHNKQQATRKQANKQTSKQVNKQTSKHTNTHKQANKLTN